MSYLLSAGSPAHVRNCLRVHLPATCSSTTRLHASQCSTSPPGCPERPMARAGEPNERVYPRDDGRQMQPAGLRVFPPEFSALLDKDYKVSTDAHTTCHRVIIVLGDALIHYAIPSELLTSSTRGLITSCQCEGA